MNLGNSSAANGARRAISKVCESFPPRLHRPRPQAPAHHHRRVQVTSFVSTWAAHRSQPQRIRLLLIRLKMPRRREPLHIILPAMGNPPRRTPRRPLHKLLRRTRNQAARRALLFPAVQPRRRRRASWLRKPFSSLSNNQQLNWCRPQRRSRRGAIQRPPLHKPASRSKTVREDRRRRPKPASPPLLLISSRRQQLQFRCSSCRRSCFTRSRPLWRTATFEMIKPGEPPPFLTLRTWRQRLTRTPRTKIRSTRRRSKDPRQLNRQRMLADNSRMPVQFNFRKRASRFLRSLLQSQRALLQLPPPAPSPRRKQAAPHKTDLPICTRGPVPPPR
jgi:hypothetical protein